MKKSVVIMMVVMFVLQVTGLFSSAQAADTNNEFVNLSEENLSGFLSVDIDSFKTQELNTWNDTRAILMDAEDVDEVEMNDIKQLVDNGKLFVFQGDASVLDEFSAAFDLQMKDFAGKDSAQGAYIYRYGNIYSVGMIKYAAPDGTVMDGPITKRNIDSILNNYALQQQEDAMNAGASDPTLQSWNTDYVAEYNVVINLGNYGSQGELLYIAGEAWIRERIFPVVIYTQSGYRKSMWDVLTRFRVTPSTGWGVEEYTTQIHCNVTNQTCIEDTYLLSNTSYTDTLSVSASGSYSVIQGQMGYTRSLSYTLNSQEIINNLPSGNVKKWDVVVVPWIASASWNIEPAIRFINNRSATQSSGAFSKFRGVLLRKFNDPLHITYTDLYWNLEGIEAGGWWGEDASM